MTIDDYLDAATRRPWIYGGGEGGFRGHDCTLFTANWALSFGRGDPALHRGRYDSRHEAEAIVSEAGGFVPLIGAALINIGWRSVMQAEEGDIGVVSFAAGRGRMLQLPAVRRGRNWIVADPRRLVALPGDLFCLMAWRAQ